MASKTNGNGARADPLEGLRASVVSLQTRARELEAGRAEMAGQHEALIADRPTLAAAAHVDGRAEAREQLKALNARALDLEGAVLGFETEAAKVRAELAGAEAALRDAEYNRRLSVAEQEAAELAAKIDAGLQCAAARWAEFTAARDELRAAQRARIARLEVIGDCFRERGNLDGRPWPPHESMGTIDARLAQLTQ